MARRHTKKHRTRKQRKMRGGYYGASGAIAPGAMEYTAGSEMGGYAVDKGGNMSNMGPNGVRPAIQYGRGRRRKSRGRKTRRMRGGGSYGAAANGFNGEGYRGIQNANQHFTKYPPFGGAAEGAFNDGARASIAKGNSFDILPKK